MYISMLRVLRNPVVKKTLYLNAYQIDLTTENYIFLSNNYHYSTYISFLQNRFGEKQGQVFVSAFHFLAIEALI